MVWNGGGYGIYDMNGRVPRENLGRGGGIESIYY